jgi:hypothetical protein
MQNNNPFKPGGLATVNIFTPSAALSTAFAPAPAEAEEILLSSISDDDDDILSAMNVTADKNLRSLAISLLIEWTKAGEHDFDSLEGIIVGAINDVEDDSEDLTDDERQEVDELLQAVVQALLDSTDMTVAQAQALFEDEDDDLAVMAADAMEEAIKGQSVDEVIANYAEKQAMLLSAVKKVVRGGKTVKIKKRTKKRRMSPAQKAALKKARLKSNNAASRASRKKSNRVRKSKGM